VKIGQWNKKTSTSNGAKLVFFLSFGGTYEETGKLLTKRMENNMISHKRRDITHCRK